MNKNNFEISEGKKRLDYIKHHRQGFNLEIANNDLPNVEFFYSKFNSVSSLNIQETKVYESSYDFIYPKLKDAFVSSTLTKEKKVKESEIDKNELSSYIITNDGIVEEKWDSIITIPSRIIEINDIVVILECLVNYETNQIETRRFKKNLLPKDQDIKLESIIVIKISERVGKIQYEFEDGKNLGYEKYFNSLKSKFDVNEIYTGKQIK